MDTPVLHKSFSNTGYFGHSRFPGVVGKSDVQRQRIFPREANRFDLSVGDVLSVLPLVKDQQFSLIVLGESC